MHTLDETGTKEPLFAFLNYYRELVIDKASGLAQRS